jgi:transcriptional regulator with XRE-family HTH domain
MVHSASMRPRRRFLKSKLPPREAEISQRLAEARRALELDQAGAARKTGIPKSTIASYELGAAPLKAKTALIICQRLILSEEWLATGRYAIAERASKELGIPNASGMDRIYRRQSMDLISSPEGESLPNSMLFSEAFDKVLAPLYYERLKANFFAPGVGQASWSETNIELGFDVTKVLVERFIWMLQNEAIRRNCSPEAAAAIYFGFLMRIGIFGFRKCMGWPTAAESVGIPGALFSDKECPISAFVPKSEMRMGRDFQALRTSDATPQLQKPEIVAK